MRIQVTDLTDKLTFAITGDEEWLAPTHADFPLPPDTKGATPKVTGELTVERESNITIMVDGHLAFTPYVPCGRCDVGVAYPVEIDVHTRFYDEDPKKGIKDRKLSREELDAYYCESGEMNLEELVNDLIQTAVPAYLAADDDTATCPDCAAADKDPSRAPAVKTMQAPPKESPFAALKGLKLKQ